MHRSSSRIASVFAVTLLVAWLSIGMSRATADPPAKGGLPQCLAELNSCTVNLGTCTVELAACQSGGVGSTP